MASALEVIASPAAAPAIEAIVEAKTYNWIGDINASFVLTSGYLVFMMQLGFAMLTVGMVRSKSAKSICLKNIIDAAAGGVGYYLFGYAFAYGDPFTVGDDGTTTYHSNPFIGSQQFALSGTPGTDLYKYLFQFVFAISTATIVSGAVAERMKFTAYLMYAFFLTAWVYPVFTHWVWTPTGWASPTRANGNLLIGSGAYDTVGSGAVHMLGGLAGLAGAWAVGPRMGRFIDGKPQQLQGHNSVFYVIGVLLLWFGFYGFNPGTMAMIVASDGTSFSPIVARCAISTSMGGCFGAVTGLLLYFVIQKVRTGHTVWDLHSAGNGALCGMIVITSGCGVYEPWAAAVGGIIGGLAYYPSSLFVSHILKIDDVVDAFTVHGTCGALGVLYEALMSEQEYIYQLYGETTPNGEPRHYGWWRGDDASVLGANVIYLIVLTAWTLGMMVPFFLLLKVMGQLRISPEEEMEGVDASHHGGSAYPGSFLDSSVHQADYKLKQDPMHSYNGTFSDEKDGLQSRVKTMEAELAQLHKQVQAITPVNGTNGVAV